MQIRTATSADLAAVVQIEAECFPAAEAATELSLARRLAAVSEPFLGVDGRQTAGGLCEWHGYGRAGPAGRDVR